MKNVLKKAAIASTLIGAAFAVSAAPILGKLQLGSGLVDASLNEIDWNAPLNPGLDLVKTYGNFFVQAAGNTGSFAGLNGFFTPATIQDMSNNPADANYMPVGPNSVSNFINLTGLPQSQWKIDANYLFPGTAGTPYLLSQQGSNIFASIAIKGTICDMGGDSICNLTDSVTNFDLALSSQYNLTDIGDVDGNGSINTADVFTLLISGGHLPNNTWSGTLTANNIPEPGSMALLGLGLIGMAAMRRKSVK